MRRSYPQGQGVGTMLGMGDVSGRPQGSGMTTVAGDRKGRPENVAYPARVDLDRSHRRGAACLRPEQTSLADVALILHVATI